MPEPTYARCADCGAVFRYADGDLARIANLLQRIEPGSEVPAAECPHCGALAYVMQVAGTGITRPRAG